MNRRAPSPQTTRDACQRSGARYMVARPMIEEWELCFEYYSQGAEEVEAEAGGWVGRSLSLRTFGEYHAGRGRCASRFASSPPPKRTKNQNVLRQLAAAGVDPSALSFPLSFTPVLLPSSHSLLTFSSRPRRTQSRWTTWRPSSSSA